MFAGKKTIFAGVGLILFGLTGGALTLLAPDVAAGAGIDIDVQEAIQLALNGIAAIGLRVALPKPAA